MNYADTTNWMFNKFPMYQKIGAAAYKPDLGNIVELLTRHSLNWVMASKNWDSSLAINTEP